MVNYKEDFQADLFLSGCEIDKQTYEQRFIWSYYFSYLINFGGCFSFSKLATSGIRMGNEKMSQYFPTNEEFRGN